MDRLYFVSFRVFRGYLPPKLRIAGLNLPFRSALAPGGNFLYPLPMEFNTILKPGLTGERTVAVTEKNTAESWGSGGLPVYSTPAMVALMEGAAIAAVDKLLPPGWSTVGTELDVKHLAATPLGMEVRAVAELLEIDRRRLRFKVEVVDGAEKIGEGFHGRFIVENERFLKKIAEKKPTP
jgi:predicted thioesterase